MADRSISRAPLTVERLREVLSYDPETGVLSRRHSRFRALQGKDAGSLDSWGYRQIRIDGRLYLAHRLAWFYVTGKWPEGGLDHANCDKADNRFANLRPAGLAENARNKPRSAANSSGLKGAFWRKDTRRWFSKICVNRRNVFLGNFDTPEAAHQAYCKAAREHHGDFARTE